MSGLTFDELKKTIDELGPPMPWRAFTANGAAYGNIKSQCHADDTGMSGYTLGYELYLVPLQIEPVIQWNDRDALRKYLDTGAMPGFGAALTLDEHPANE